MKTIKILTKLWWIIIGIWFITGCSKENQKCYTCQQYQGGYLMEQHTCDKQMLEYYMNTGYTCYEDQSFNTHNENKIKDGEWEIMISNRNLGGMDHLFNLFRLLGQPPSESKN